MASFRTTVTDRLVQPPGKPHHSSFIPLLQQTVVLHQLIFGQYGHVFKCVCVCVCLCVCVPV